MDLLTFRNVWVEYGDKVVLENVDLSIAQGSFVSIVGPSGAGKSTFLRLVLGQEAPTKGAIDLDGRRLRAEPGPDRGVVFQKYSVFPHLNARDNVVFGLDCEGSPVRGRLSGARRRAARTRPTPCWPPSAWATAATSIRPSCRAACSSAWPSPRP